MRLVKYYYKNVTNKYSQTCFSDHLSTTSTFCVSLENGFSFIKHVLKEPVYKDHFLCFPWAVAIDRFDCIYLGTCIFSLPAHSRNPLWPYYSTLHPEITSIQWPDHTRSVLLLPYLGQGSGMEWRIEMVQAYSLNLLPILSLLYKRIQSLHIGKQEMRTHT